MGSGGKARFAGRTWTDTSSAPWHYLLVQVLEIEDVHDTVQIHTVALDASQHAFCTHLVIFSTIYCPECEGWTHKADGQQYPSRAVRA